MNKRNECYLWDEFRLISKFHWSRWISRLIYIQTQNPTFISFFRIIRFFTWLTHFPVNTQYGQCLDLLPPPTVLAQCTLFLSSYLHVPINEKHEIKIENKFNWKWKIINEEKKMNCIYFFENRQLQPPNTSSFLSFQFEANVY